MTTNVCRLCCSHDTKLTNSINDDLVIKLFDLLPDIVLSDDPKLPVKVCQLCYSKTKIAIDFIGNITKSQKCFSSQRKTLKQAIEPEGSGMINETVAKMHRISGISVKKIVPSNTVSIKEVLKSGAKINEEIDSSDVSDNESFQSFQERKVSEIEESNDEDCSDDDNSLLSKPREVFLDAVVVFTCASCKAEFSDFDTLNSHVKRSCPVKMFGCNACGKQFLNKTAHYQHTRNHRLYDKLICSVCRKKFRSKVGLQKHIKKSHQSVLIRDGIFRCSLCVARFSSKVDLLAHLKGHV